MRPITTYQLHLNQYEGSLDLLVHLIQKKELDINSIFLKEITQPFMELFKDKAREEAFDFGQDFILLTAQLTLLKSRALLPRDKLLDENIDTEDDPRFDIIHHLIDYCKFKEAANFFSNMEDNQGDLFTRGIKGDDDVKKPLGLDTVSLEELQLLFNDLLAKAKDKTGTIEEEEFRVYDKIAMIRKIGKSGSKVPFLFLFENASGKLEIIVTFLAVLEMLKNGEVKVIKEDLIQLVFNG
jgi:segregation and condensation protein A